MADSTLTEKVSVNINTSTLSTIDLLVDHGYYSNRSDFINQALRSALEHQDATVERIIKQQTKSSHNFWFLGISKLFRQDIEPNLQDHQPFSIHGYGLLILDDDIPEDMLFAVVQSIQVKGRVQCSPAIKAHYGLK